MVRNRLPAQVVKSLQKKKEKKTTYSVQISDKIIVVHTVRARSKPSIQKGKRRIIVYGLVARYGPQSVASASG